MYWTPEKALSKVAENKYLYLYVFAGSLFDAASTATGLLEPHTKELNPLLAATINTESFTHITLYALEYPLIVTVFITLTWAYTTRMQYAKTLLEGIGTLQIVAGLSNLRAATGTQNGIFLLVAAVFFGHYGTRIYHVLKTDRKRK